ncbi:MAG: ABC transporter ATP-binding protein [Eubacterium sp.]|nr:ABC transporter ATP-binding protein [Eubacterium sp.]
MSKKSNKKEHSMISNIFYFLKLLFSISPGFVICELLWGILESVPSDIISVIGIKYIVDVVTSGEHLERIIYAVLIIAVIIVTSAILCSVFGDLCREMIKEKIYYSLNKKLYEKAKSLDLESYDNPDFYNNFILTIESSSDNIQNILGLVRNYIANIISLIAISSVLLTIDPLCLVIILLSIIIFMPLSKKIGNLQMGRRTDNTILHRRSDYFQRIFYLQDYAKEVRMNNIKPLLIDRYNEAADAVVENQKKYWIKISSNYCIQETGVQVLGFMFALPLYLGYLVIVKKSIGAGDFVATFNGAYSIAISINFLTVWALAQFSERAKMIEKYREFLISKCKIDDGALSKAEDEPKEIIIKDLSFTYPGNDKPTLKNINLTIKPYEKIALVGYNGAGKTTLTNLLLRLYDATSGEIIIDGENIKNSQLETHRNKFAAVFQDFQTYACSLGENIALDDKVDTGRAKDALEYSGFTKMLSKDLDTELLREFDDSGVMLSGGESQKVAVARAFYKDCPYAILDEPSANLDPIAEYNLNQAMLNAADNKTVIFISHRLSTTVNADKIYVMENGEIIESGSHTELMQLNGTYAYMFNLQAEKYQETSK